MLGDESSDFDVSPTLLSLLVTVIIGIAALCVRGLSGGLAAAACVLVVMGRLLYLPWHWLLLIGAPSLRWQRRHPVFWDRAMLVTLPGTEYFLLRFATRWPDEARALLEDIIAHSPGQRAAARRAKERARL